MSNYESRLVYTTFVNSLGEKVTHFSPRGGLIANVSFNHCDREIAVDLEGEWHPVANFPPETSEKTIKIALTKAINSLIAVNKIGAVGEDEDIWDKFINKYEGGI